MPTLARIEQCLLPAPETIHWKQGELTTTTYTTRQKVVYYTKNFFLLGGLVAALPFTLAYDLLRKKPAMTAAAPKNQSPIWPPPQRGFATSLFQTSGLGTKWSASPALQGKCDWDGWMDVPGHIHHPQGFDYRDFFTDILSNPDPYIAMLKAQNVTAHRFSLEWSVIEPKQGEIDGKAVALYQNFINKLLAAGITPSVTLSHFVMPDWFYKRGNFQKMENVDTYVRFALKAMELFPQVKDWWSFNELGVKAFQQTREVYPTDLPKKTSLFKRIQAAATSTRNMLIAHCKLHQAVRRMHPDKHLGVTHQWLKFDMARGNWIERLVRHFFETFTFKPIYGFLKTGHYTFAIPFITNTQFKIPSDEFNAEGRFLMRLGVQAYPKPRLQMGLNYGRRSPCIPGSFQNAWVTFGSSCEPGGTLMRFGPRWNAEGMDGMLDEAFALTNEVYITEYGSDASIHQWGQNGFTFNNAAQAEYLQRLTQQIEAYSMRTGRTIKGLYCWSDIENMEWELGKASRLPVIKPILDKNRRMVGWDPTPASEYLARAYRSQKAEKLVSE